MIDMKESRQKWMKSHTNISVTKATKKIMNTQRTDKESFDGLINRLLTGRTEKERKYDPILRRLSEDKKIIKEIHDNALKLRNMCIHITDTTCYTTATYVCLRRSGDNVTMRQVEDLMGVCGGTITRYYRRLI